MLYRKSGEHAKDCERYPIETLPRRVFLDTNVINRLVEWGAQIFEFEAIPPETDQTLANDIEALMHVLYGSERTCLELVASTKSLEELSNTPDPAWRRSLLGYGVEFVHHNATNEERRFAIDFGRRLIGSQFVAALPDRADQELIAHAIALRCDTFCTCDRKSIVKKRDRVRLPIRVLTPVEWWAHVKPWAGLWS